MFYCIGENQVNGNSVGKGITASIAIKNWAYCEGWTQVLQEFEQYNPTVIEGQELNVNYEVPEPCFILVPV